MTKPFALLCLCLALGLVAAGCGDDDDDDGGNGAAPTTEEPAGGGAGEEAGEDAGGGGGGADRAEVGMEGIQFDPDEVSVAAGGTVTWTNNEDVGHDVTKESGPGPDFSSGQPGAMGEGDSFEQTFEQPGEYEYFCTIHPNMTGVVAVE